MKPNYVWLIETDLNKNGRWQPLYGEWYGTKDSATFTLADWREFDPSKKFRAWKYVAEGPKK